MHVELPLQVEEAHRGADDGGADDGIGAEVVRESLHDEDERAEEEGVHHHVQLGHMPLFEPHHIARQGFDAHRDRQDAYGQVDEEEPVPREVREDEGGEGRRQHGGDGDQRGVESDAFAQPAFRVGESQEGHVDGHHGGGADAL